MAFRKKSLTSLDVAVIVKELSNLLTDGLISNIYSIDGGGYLLKIRTLEGITSYLVIEPAVRLHLTKFIPPAGTSGRTPLFRRFLRGSKIRSVRQYEFERIVTMGVTKGGIEVEVIVELMPRGIMAVLDSSRKVLVSSEDIKLRDRRVYPGLTYVFPPLLPDPRRFNTEQWLKTVSDVSNLGAALVKKLGIPPEVVNEVLNEAERKLKPSVMSLSEIARVRESILAFIESVVSNPTPVIVKCRENYVSFHPFTPSNMPSDCDVLTFSLFNEAVDEYYRAFYASELRGVEERRISSEAAKLRAVIDKAVRDLSKLREEYSKVELALRFFDEKYDVLDDAWRCVKSIVKSAGWGEVLRACRYVSRVEPSSGVFEVKIGGRSTLLKITEEVHVQYSRLRKKYTRLKDKIAQAEKHISELERKLEEKSAVLDAKARIKPLLKKVEWYTSYHWIITSSGLLAIGGRDAQQNEKVVKKYLGNSDIFIHAEVHGASAFVLKCGGNKPSEKDIYEVSVLAASYSRGWKVGVGALNVFWVWGRQVSKSAPPGQYLPKGAFMIYGKRNYIKSVPLRLAIGVQISDNRYFEVITGPEDLVSKRASSYAVLVPGNIHQRRIAAEIREKFSAGDERLKTLTMDDILERVPGPSTIVKLVT
ncbi:MAG: NFACT family protein [Desulfurococcales archaeon]|nr:NFACT family protein [Desulfurococcales archaeon]